MSDTWNIDPILCPCGGEGWLVGNRCPHHSEGVPNPEESSVWRAQRGPGGRRHHLIRVHRTAYRHYQELSGTPPDTFAARVKNRIQVTKDQLELAKRCLIQARLICTEILSHREAQTKARLAKTKNHQASTDIQRLHDLLAGKETWNAPTQGTLPNLGD